MVRYRSQPERRALDVGFGALAGDLRNDARVVVLERTNLADASDAVHEAIDVVTIDVSYVALADAVPQLEPLAFATGADLVALVKPMFELKAGVLPPDARLDEAVANAVSGIQRTPWRVVATCESPIRGARGAREAFVHALRVSHDLSTVPSDVHLRTSGGTMDI